MCTRRVRREDFHVPLVESAVPAKRELVIEAILSFPELDAEDGDHTAAPEFFHEMAGQITAETHTVG